MTSILEREENSSKVNYIIRNDKNIRDQILRSVRIHDLSFFQKNGVSSRQASVSGEVDFDRAKKSFYNLMAEFSVDESSDVTIGNESIVEHLKDKVQLTRSLVAKKLDRAGSIIGLLEVLAISHYGLDGDKFLNDLFIFLKTQDKGNHPKDGEKELDYKYRVIGEVTDRIFFFRGDEDVISQTLKSVNKEFDIAKVKDVLSEALLIIGDIDNRKLENSSIEKLFKHYRTEYFRERFLDSGDDMIEKALNYLETLEEDYNTLLVFEERFGKAALIKLIEKTRAVK